MRMLPKRIRRLPRFDYVGERTYFLTILVKHRRRVFTDGAIVAICREQFLRAATSTRFAFSATCYMPDHLHALVTGLRGDSDFVQFMKLGKQLTGFHAKQTLGTQLWRPGYYDHLLRLDEDPARYIEYIRANPVKARLVTSADDYPYTWIDLTSKPELQLGRATSQQQL